MEICATAAGHTNDSMTREGGDRLALWENHCFALALALAPFNACPSVPFSVIPVLARVLQFFFIFGPLTGVYLLSDFLPTVPVHSSSRSFFISFV